MRKEKMQMLGYYNYTVVLTYISLAVSVIGMTQAFEGRFRIAILCLAISGLCDMFDGKIARTKKDRTEDEKRFGIQIDSLSDLICFGLLPALIVYTSGTGALRFMPAAVYVLCALIRLAWFNVDEEERQSRESGSRDVYYGIPVTMSALILPAMMSLCTKYNWNTGTIGTLTLMIMAAAFLAPFKVKKPRLAGKIGLLIFGTLGLLAVLAGGMDV